MRYTLSMADSNRLAASCRRQHSSARSHYETLSVSRSSTAKEIKARFYELSRKHHPDVSPDSAKKFTEINAAYSVLREEKSRRDYDKTLPGERTPLGQAASGYRPASGLSRRRTRPMGTPPSSPFRGAYPLQPNRPAGFGYGDNPSPERDVRNQHFEYEEHKERHSAFDSRYNLRVQEELSRRNADLKDNFFARFFGIGGLVLVVIILTGGISNVRAETPAQRQPEKEPQEIDWLDAMTSRKRAYGPRICNWK